VWRCTSAQDKTAFIVEAAISVEPTWPAEEGSKDEHSTSTASSRRPSSSHHPHSADLLGESEGSKAGERERAQPERDRDETWQPSLHQQQPMQQQQQQPMQQQPMQQQLLQPLQPEQAPSTHMTFQTTHAVSKSGTTIGLVQSVAL
jgi:hypothetical protein